MDFNTLHPNLKFTAEIERDIINYLDISIQKLLKTSIYRKPTFRDTIIPYTSNHPTQHKYAVVKFLSNRLNAYNLQEQEYKQELSVIQNILHNNSFPIKPQKQQPNNTKRQHSTQTSKHKWATFTYKGKETLYITNMFRHTDLKIAFCTNNTLESLLKHRNLPTDKYALYVVHKLTCPDCKKAYVGKTGRRFSICYKEHKSAFHNNGHTSKFAQQLHEEAHSFGPISNSMQVLHHQR